MKIHTSNFKNGIKEFGRQIDSKITYTIDNEEIELGSEDLNSVSPHYESAILKSTMRQLDIDSNVEIPLETVINYQFGLKVGNEYEYLNFGNYVVYNVEKQEDTNSYKITCYDKMLYSMKDYESLGITYPITIRDYLSAICSHLDLTFKNEEDEFANYDKEIASELYLDVNGNSLGYTFRDVLDEIAGATGSTICINEDDDELEVRYVNETNDTIDEEYLKDINVKFGEKYGPVNSIVLSRSAESDNIYLRDEDSVALNGLCEIKIKDNQILNGNNRDEFLPDLLDSLDGLEYYINDYSSTGILYYNVCDMYNVSIGENTYNCLMLNDEVNVTQGLEENIYAEMPEESETDYTKADKTDKKINKAFIIVNKQMGEIVSEVSTATSTVNGLQEVVNAQGENIEALGTRLTQTADGFTANITSLQEQIDEGASYVKTTSVTIDDNGLSVATDTSKIRTTMTNNEFKITDSGNTDLAKFGYDETTQTSVAEMDNLTVNTYLHTGNHRIEKYKGNRTGFFYIGG